MMHIHAIALTKSHVESGDHEHKFFLSMQTCKIFGGTCLIALVSFFQICRNHAADVSLFTITVF